MPRGIDATSFDRVTPRHLAGGPPVETAAVGSRSAPVLSLTFDPADRLNSSIFFITRPPLDPRRIAPRPPALPTLPQPRHASLWTPSTAAYGESPACGGRSPRENLLQPATGSPGPLRRSRLEAVPRRVGGWPFSAGTWSPD